MMLKVKSYYDDKKMIVQPISYGSTNYETILKNDMNSTVKTVIDEWYKNNLSNYTNYLSQNAYFCSDRKIYQGTGYKLSTTFYNIYAKIFSKMPSLKCKQLYDHFSLTNILATLDYPVAMITLDEVLISGFSTSIPNNQAYLYNGKIYWTMTSSDYDESNLFSHVSYISGAIGTVSGRTTGNFGVRPVINIKQNITISKGDGTALNPFQLSGD